MVVVVCRWWRCGDFCFQMVSDGDFRFDGGDFMFVGGDFPVVAGGGGGRRWLKVAGGEIRMQMIKYLKMKN